MSTNDSFTRSSGPIWVGTEDEANRAITSIREYPVAGVDSEFTGVQIGKESCVGKARIHVFSVAAPTGPLLPTGVNQATAYVFAGPLALCPSVKEWLEDDTIIKPVHNQPVDSHAFRNAGIRLRGAVNTLAMARYWFPERAKYEGFDLDSLGRDFLSQGKTEDFDDLLGYDDFELRTHEVTKQRCACGVLGCRKRLSPHDVKQPERVNVEYKAKVRRHLDLFGLNPKHPLWPRYLAYAAWDAVLALWLYQYMLREGRKERPYPWNIPL